MYQHPSFDNSNFDFDLVLVRLKSAILIDGITTAIVSLPNIGITAHTGVPVFVSGWGDTLNLAESKRFLRGVVLNVTSPAECANAYALAGFTLTSSMMCAAGLKAGSCHVRKSVDDSFQNFFYTF